MDGCEAEADKISRLSPEGFLVGTGNKAYSFREAYKDFDIVHITILINEIGLGWVNEKGDKSDDHVAPTAI